MTDDDMPDRRRWHLEKSVSLGHIATTGAVIITGMWWFVTNEGRISEMETAARYNERRLEQVEQTQVTQAEWIATKLEQIRLEQREDILRLGATLREGFVRIEKKLDTKADK